jgi:hypothetical protein
MFAVLVSLPLVLLRLTSVAVQPPCTAGPAVETAAEAAVLVTFKERIDSYMQLHDDVERSLGPQRLSEDPQVLFEAVEAMRSGLANARPDARRGAIFTDDVSALIRLRLEARLAECNQTVDQVLAFLNEERLPGSRKPSLNKRFPWELGSAMWPSFLASLPPLPEELQYRFADRDLVLIDMHADMVVDIAVNALPAPGHTAHATHHR